MRREANRLLNLCVSYMTSCGELKIVPQSVSLIRWPFSVQPSFAFCFVGAIGWMLKPVWDKRADFGAELNWAAGKRQRSCILDRSKQGFCFSLRKIEFATRNCRLTFRGQCNQHRENSERTFFCNVQKLVRWVAVCFCVSHRRNFSTALPLTVQTRNFEYSPQVRIVHQVCHPKRATSTFHNNRTICEFFVREVSGCGFVKTHTTTSTAALLSPECCPLKYMNPWRVIFQWHTL